MLAWFSAQERRKKKSHMSTVAGNQATLDVSGFLCTKIATDIVEGDDIV